MDPDSVEFVVVDWDEEVHCFHQHFFPQSVRLECKNILDINLRNTDLLYMNFCSIPSGADNDSILFNKEEVLKWIWNCMKTMHCSIMVSAVIRDARSEKQKNKGQITVTHSNRIHLLPAGFQQCLEDPELFGAGVVSRRINFMTWMVKPESCAAQNTPHKLQEWFKSHGITWNYHTEFCPGALVNINSETPRRRYRIERRTPKSVYLRLDGDENGDCILKRITSVKLVNDSHKSSILTGDSDDSCNGEEVSGSDHECGTSDPVARKLSFDDEDISLTPSLPGFNLKCVLM
jgi:hypothetical protein